MTSKVLVWFVRLAWASLPLTLGAQLADAAAGHSAPVRVAIIAMSWLVWGVVLAASLVQLPRALVVLRCGTPLGVVAAVFADVDHSPTTLGWIGLATACLVAAASMSGDVGLPFIDGASYGEERRYALRVPAALLFGPIPALWVIATVPVPVGVLLTAAGAPLFGIPVLVAGAALAWWGFHTLDRLSRRWCVMVPAGITLVDHLALAEPTLIPAKGIAFIGPARTDSTALDLTAGATGLICQVTMVGVGEFLPAARRGEVTEMVDTDSVLFSVTRPGAMLAEAARRGLPVGPDGAISPG